jgi:hypothetical protein
MLDMVTGFLTWMSTHFRSTRNEPSVWINIIFDNSINLTNIKCTVFWDVTLFSMEYGYQHFEETCGLHFQGGRLCNFFFITVNRTSRSSGWHSCFLFSRFRFQMCAESLPVLTMLAVSSFLQLNARIVLEVGSNRIFPCYTLTVLLVDTVILWHERQINKFSNR